MHLAYLFNKKSTSEIWDFIDGVSFILAILQTHDKNCLPVLEAGISGLLRLKVAKLITFPKHIPLTGSNKK